MMIDKKTKTNIPFSYQFLAGAIAGVSEILVFYPLDLVKTRRQLETGKNNMGIFKTIVTIVKNEGPTKLYSAISAPLLMEAPKRAVKFGSNEKWGAFYKNNLGNNVPKETVALLSGASAGVTESFVVVPFELVKIKMQDKFCKYTKMSHAVKDIVKENGVLGLYKGLESTIWRHSVWNASYFALILKIRSCFSDNIKINDTLKDLVSGTIGGIFGTILNIPFDVVKSRIQVGSNKYIWTIPSLFKVAKEEGISALYKGFLPKVLRLGPGGGVLLVVYNTVMSVLIS